MADALTALTLGLNSLDAAKKLIQGLRATEKAYEKAELNMLASELMNQVADAKIALAEAKTEISTLRENLDRESTFQQRLAELQNIDGFYYEIQGSEQVGRPFCPACIEAIDRIVRLQVAPSDFHQIDGDMKCPKCHEHYFVKVKRLPDNSNHGDTEILL